MSILISLDFSLLVAGLSVLSGVGSYLQGVREEQLKKGFLDFAAEITLALVVGLAVAFLGQYKQWSETLVCFLVLILSNNGGEAMLKIKRFLNKQIDQRLGSNNNGG